MKYKPIIVVKNLKNIIIRIIEMLNINDAEIAKQILSKTGNENFNIPGNFVKPSKHLFTIDKICPACNLEHKGEIRGYIDRDYQELGYYIKCPITNCKIYMRRK